MEQLLLRPKFLHLSLFWYLYFSVFCRLHVIDFVKDGSVVVVFLTIISALRPQSLLQVQAAVAVLVELLNEVANPCLLLLARLVNVNLEFRDLVLLAKNEFTTGLSLRLLPTELKAD